MSTGWKLDRAERAILLGEHPPRYARPVADHVTYTSGDQGDDAAKVPGEVADARIVGRADDGNGVEAMVVEIDGSTARPDGGTWHITWSLGAGREAKESNAVIAAGGWNLLDGGAIALSPARW